MNHLDRPRDSWKMSIAAMVVFIVWGVAINWPHGWTARIQVALTQGIISLLSTYFSAELVVWFVRKFRNWQWPVVAGGCASYVTIYVGVLSGHKLAGTPEFWPTVIPGMMTGFFFCFGYALRVSRFLRRQNRGSSEIPKML